MRHELRAACMRGQAAAVRFVQAAATCGHLVLRRLVAESSAIWQQLRVIALRQNGWALSGNCYRNPTAGTRRGAVVVCLWRCRYETEIRNNICQQLHKTNTIHHIDQVCFVPHHTVQCKDRS